MIEISKIKLLIFDLDGTLHVANRTEYESVKRGFEKLNLKMWLSEKDMEKFFGKVSGDELYMKITPPDKQNMWMEVKSAVRGKYEQVFRDFACLYPGVKDTLKILKARGYKLALCSNSSALWFDSAVYALGLSEYFDYCECFGHNNLNKTKMVEKMIKTSGITEAAEIGDTKGDILAARENNLLSIGVLYGYGGEEPKQADITIEGFLKLLEIFA